MDPSPAAPARQPWPSLWFSALASLLAQLALCQFFTFGRSVPFSIDVNPSNLWKYADHFPPRGEFLTLNWFGIANLPPTLNPFSLAAAHLPAWLFFTAYAPVVATCALLAMTLFLRELDLPRPAALLGGVIYAWQGDLLPFVLPGHYGYITTWPFFALAAWAALRGPRLYQQERAASAASGRRAAAGHALIAGASCGMMVGLQPDRGSIASLLIAALYLGPLLRQKMWPRLETFRRTPAAAQLAQFALCVGTALLVSLAGFLALYQGNIAGVKLGGASDRDQLFALATQYSLGPSETFTYLVPGFFGWDNTHPTGPYWGWIGQTPGYSVSHQGTRNLNLAISTVGTVGSILAVLGAALLLPGAAGRFFGRDKLTPRQLDFGRLLLVLGLLSLVLSWGYHTPLYRPLFALPLMDKWRNPLKWLGIFDFAAVTLGAFGAAQLVRSLADATQRRALSLFFATAVGLLIVFVLASYPVAIAVAGFLAAEDYQPAEIANVMHTMHVSLGVGTAIGALLWLVLVGAWHGDRLQRWDIVNPWLRQLWQRALLPENRPGALALCGAVLAAAQLGWVATQFITPASLANLTATNPLLDSLRAEGPLVRVAVPQPQDSLLNFFLQNQFAADRISSIDISAASRIPDTLTAFVNAFSGHTARLWLLGGVKNVAIGRTELTSLRQDPEVSSNIVAADGYTLTVTTDDLPTHALVRLRDYFGKATFVPAAEVRGSDAELLKRLADPKWNPRATVLLTTASPGALDQRGVLEAKLSPAHLPPDTSPRAVSPAAMPASVPINVTHYTPHQIDLDLTAPSAGYVLINDQYDPDWQATLNGRPAPLLRADYLLRSIAVPAGSGRVTLRYVAHYRVALFSLPVVAANDLSDAIMLLAFLGGTLLIRPKM